MTYPAQSPVPNDDWFPPNPLDSMPIATDKSEEKKEEETMHEKMYRIATKNHSSWKGGGSEQVWITDK